MFSQDLINKRCVMVCGGGGVGKTTLAASIAVAATEHRNRVLVVTIDPAKRLAEAFGFTIEEMLAGGEPKKIDAERAKELGLREGVELSVGILNPKYILGQILDQVLTPDQRDKLTSTLLYQQLSEMVYGLQEYTAYEWVTRMIKSEMYDFIVLDTPPALHAKDFFNVPEKIRNLMQSRVFQIFVPKKKGFFTAILTGAMSFSWIEKLLGAKIFSESKMFFETFNLLRDRILERCDWLSQFFTAQEVGVVAVATVESSAQLELEGLVNFMRSKRIPLNTVLVNQMEQKPETEPGFADAVRSTSNDLHQKWRELENHRRDRAERAENLFDKIKMQYQTAGQIEVYGVPMVYSDRGLAILRETAARLKST